MTIDDAHAERLVSLAPSIASALTSSSSDNDATSIQSLYETALAERSQLEREQDEKYLSLAPTFLSLHQQAASSKELLTSLETFLSTFQSDLSTLSTHISALQTTSHQIDSRLDATRDVEIQLASFLSDIALSPRIVDLFFETEPESRPELWLKAVKQLERVLEATSPSATLSLPESSSSSNATTTTIAELGDVQAVKEVRSVAESCKHIVASKLRTYLTAPHATIKASVTTNLQVLQTSILLRHHRPLYAFLARQMPRVAIDVQRSYVAAARLYFETAFRRYARSLGVVRKKWIEASTSGAQGIADPVPSTSKGGDYATTAITSLQNGMSTLAKATANISTGAGASGNFFPAQRQTGGSTPNRTGSQDNTAALGDADSMSASTDPWLFPTNRLLYSKLEAPVATVLGYLADESGFRASPENLFRSLSLVLVDNACSEYTFLVRFFEGVSSEGGDNPTPVRKESETASAAEDGDADETLTATVAEEEAENGPQPSVVQLSLAEQTRLKGRGASEEIFKQIMEPAVTTWMNFTKTLLTPSSSSTSSAAASALNATSAAIGAGGVGAGGSGNASVNGPAGYFSLLSMVQLNDAVLGLINSRGCGNALLEGAVMGFKIQSYPLLKRFLDDQIAAITHLTNPSSASSTSSGGMWNVLSSFASSSTTATLTAELGEAIAIRYASLFTKTLFLLFDNPDQGIFSALTRLRGELAKLFTLPTTDKTWGKPEKHRAVQTLIRAIEAIVSVGGGTGLSVHEKIQNEFAFWKLESVKLAS